MHFFLFNNVCNIAVLNNGIAASCSTAPHIPGQTSDRESGALK